MNIIDYISVLQHMFGAHTERCLNMKQENSVLIEGQLGIQSMKSFCIVITLLACTLAECTERRIRKFPVVFRDCEAHYDKCDCLRRKETYLKENDCTDIEQYNEVEEQLKQCGEPSSGLLLCSSTTRILTPRCVHIQKRLRVPYCPQWMP